MSHWMIGDVQGCRPELEGLLEKIAFDPSQDYLWLTGDLVNRGGESLEVLRLLHPYRKRIRMVLGNHDLALLAQAHKPKALPRELRRIPRAADGEELLAWLGGAPLLHQERIATAKGPCRFIMTHAGIPHLWTRAKAAGLADEARRFLAAGRDIAKFWGDRPLQWRGGLQGNKRLRCILNYFTRMRLVAPSGEMDLVAVTQSRRKGRYKPWFQYDLPALRDKRNVLVFGHWAALKGNTRRKRVWGLDTGCVWGNYLTARRAEDGAIAVQRARPNRRS